MIQGERRTDESDRNVNDALYDVDKKPSWDEKAGAEILQLLRGEAQEEDEASGH